jgi:peptide deformylase
MDGDHSFFYVCLKQHLADMIEFVKNSQNPELAEKYKLRPGVGLAAPQTLSAGCPSRTIFSIVIKKLHS